jgi:hypothetical protein
MTDARMPTPAFTLRPPVLAHVGAATSLVRDRFASIAQPLAPRLSAVCEMAATVAVIPWGERDGGRSFEKLPS